MISVCMAVYNGEKYLREQLESILRFGEIGEVVISDDGSTDKSQEIVLSFNDPRIKVFAGPRSGLIKNFENAIAHATGSYIFLSDQDDVWLENKVPVMMVELEHYDLVVSDCRVVDEALSVTHDSMFFIRKPGSGFLKNLAMNSYIGCCMAFNRRIVDCALPFPEKIPMHDWWIGLIAETGYKIKFIKQPLLLYRRHGNNASETATKSASSLLLKVRWRFMILWLLFLRVMSVA